jgi:hypothetical protein
MQQLDAIQKQENKQTSKSNLKNKTPILNYQSQTHARILKAQLQDCRLLSPQFPPEKHYYSIPQKKNIKNKEKIKTHFTFSSLLLHNFLNGKKISSSNFIFISSKYSATTFSSSSSITIPSPPPVITSNSVQHNTVPQALILLQQAKGIIRYSFLHGLGIQVIRGTMWTKVKRFAFADKFSAAHRTARLLPLPPTP